MTAALSIEQQTQARSKRVFSWRALHIRAALIAMPLLLLLCIAMLAMLRYYSAQNALESTQRMNLGLARYIVEHQPSRLLDNSGLPDTSQMTELAMHVMMINPSVEVYMLDAQGLVLAHALDQIRGLDPVGRQINLAKVEILVSLKTDSLRLPLLGDDPRQWGVQNIVSIAALGNDSQPVGYLYIVLNGLAQQSVTANLSNSVAFREVVIALLLATLMTMTFMLIALRNLTRPLRQLTAELTDFRNDSDQDAAIDRHDEIAVLRGAVQALQSRIALQFKRLDESDQQRRELVSNISHDLRTPLSNIQGYVESILIRADQISVETRTEYLKTALRHIDLLGRRVSDLFELSKLDAGRIEPKYEVFCLAELLQDVVQNYQLLAQQRGVRIHLSAGSHTQTRVSADIALIERVLQNLIDNALRYTSGGGEVSVALTAKGPLIEVCVSDTGRGIAVEHIPHIFERYWRGADSDDDEPKTSSGLGLAIVKRILDLHSSVVRVHSELARGTRIEFGLKAC